MVKRWADVVAHGLVFTLLFWAMLLGGHVVWGFPFTTSHLLMTLGVMVAGWVSGAAWEWYILPRWQARR